MNATQQTTQFGSGSGYSLEPEMANLLQMTNEVVSKIKQQIQEMYL